MKYFSLFLISLIMFTNTGFSAYLPVVDVSRGDVSARAIFGELADKKTSVEIASPKNNTHKNVVARTSATQKNENISNMDVLKPLRPSDNIWARNGDTPLRMPRMDEIAVINYDNALPEETLNTKPDLIGRDETLNELKQLRAEIAQLRDKQKLNEEKIARARPIMVRTPVAGNNDTVPAQKTSMREIVPANNVNHTENNVPEPTLTATNRAIKMSPNELKKAFKKTYLSENKHLSTYQIDERYDEISDMTSFVEGFSAARDLSESGGGVRPLEIKISFLNGDAALSRENYNILSETAGIVVNNPKRAVQIAIPESVMYDNDARKLASRRLAIIEQVLRDTGVAEQRIVPVLSQRDDDTFVLRIISGDTFEVLNQQKRNMFGDNIAQKTYKSMSW